MKGDEAKQIVASGYDLCAHEYSTARSYDPSPELVLLTERLEEGDRILEVGCGAGIPVTKALAGIGQVVGVDISATQIELARKNVPSASLIHGDIMAQKFDAGSFDAVVAFYAMFHLPREEQGELLIRAKRWLRPAGYLLATLARSDEPGYTESDFFGETMYWSHYEASWYVDRIVEAGFDVIHFDEVGHGYRGVPCLPPERHPIILAQSQP